MIGVDLIWPLPSPSLPPAQADICQLGMDQRKVNVLAREYCDNCKPKRLKPVILSHPMLPGLLQVGRGCASSRMDGWMEGQLPQSSTRTPTLCVSLLWACSIPSPALSTLASTALCCRRRSK